MAESISEKVQRFRMFNQEMIQTATCEDNLQHQGIHAKILLCAIIDSLAKSRFPDIKYNGERFKQLVEQCCEWPEHDRISLLHLNRALALDSSSPLFSDLKTWTEQEVQKNLKLTHRIISVSTAITQEPSIDLALEFWPMDSENKPLKLRGHIPEKFQHLNLLWLYRNSLMHEYRSPGRASELGRARKKEPYYQQVSKIADLNQDTGFLFNSNWELVYPTFFFKSLAEKALNSVALYHLKQQTSPFEVYSDSSYWMPEFD